jgi:hypothetical protein
VLSGGYAGDLLEIGGEFDVVEAGCGEEIGDCRGLVVADF